MVGLLADLAEKAIWYEPVIDSTAPDSDDNHLWALLESQPESQLITGDRLLIDNAPNREKVVSPREFMDMVVA